MIAQFISRFSALRFLAAAILALSGCATPYSPPVVLEEGAPRAPAFGGIMSYAEADDVRVVWIHGMCSHAEAWAENRHSIFARAAQLGPAAPVVIGRRNEPKRVTYSHNVAGHDLELRYLVWSPLADAAKVAIKLENGDDLTRAKFNRQLKAGLINDCFSDAVIYTGSAGDTTRSWIRGELCDALGGAISGGGRCLIDPNAKARKTIFVAESLGSKLLADGIASIWARSSPAGRSQVAARLADVQMVFLLANQLPLLNSATHGAAKIAVAASGAAVPEDELMEIFSEVRDDGSKLLANEPDTPLRFVAFTDPNDLLSYRLYRGAHVPGDISVTNILVSNDYTYLGLLERPDTAHCGYGWNPAVIATVARGYDGTKVGSLEIDVPKECGLGE